MNNITPVEIKPMLGSIEDNLDAVELSIKEKVAEYKGIVVTEDAVKDGKNFLASIRKEKTALDNERKAIKEIWMKPYLDFESRAKKIIALYDEPINAINGQIKAYDDMRKEEKRHEIQHIYETVIAGSSISDIKQWIPLKRIYNVKWENATYNGKKIREDIEMLASQTALSISTIENFGSEFEKQALDTLKSTGSLQMALDEMNRLQKTKELIEANKRAREEAEARAKEEAKPEPVADPVPDKVEIEMVDFATAAGFEVEREIEVTVKVRESFLPDLLDFLMDNYIKYEVN